MKVLKRGELPEDKIHNIICHNCKSELEFYEKEARLVNDRNEICLVVTCPVCKQELWKAK